jgi:hypothetical protein
MAHVHLDLDRLSLPIHQMNYDIYKARSIAGVQIVPANVLCIACLFNSVEREVRRSRRAYRAHVRSGKRNVVTAARLLS